MIPNTAIIAATKPKIETVIIAESKEAKALATAGGTPSGILITNLGLSIKRVKISADTIPTIKATKRPVELIPLTAAPSVKKQASETTPVATASFL